MREPNMPPNLKGAELVVNWFGHWPSFHDGEIVEMLLRTHGNSHLTIKTWIMTSRLNEAGRFINEKPETVRFNLADITDISLENFSNQNVIDKLAIDREGSVWTLTLSPCYGISGWLRASLIEVELL